MSYRSAPRWPRKPAKPYSAADNHRFFRELCGRIDGSIPREDASSAADRAMYAELRGRIDGSISRDEHDDGWAEIVAVVRETHERFRAMSK